MSIINKPCLIYDIKTPITPQWLNKNGFKTSSLFSSPSETVYYKRIPAYHYNLSVILDAEFVLYPTANELRVNVYDTTSRSFYASWYNRQYGGENRVVKLIDQKIEHELIKLGVLQPKSKNKNNINSKDSNK